MQDWRCRGMRLEGSAVRSRCAPRNRRRCKADVTSRRDVGILAGGNTAGKSRKKSGHPGRDAGSPFPDNAAKICVEPIREAGAIRGSLLLCQNKRGNAGCKSMDDIPMDGSRAPAGAHPFSLTRFPAVVPPANILSSLRDVREPGGAASLPIGLRNPAGRAPYLAGFAFIRARIRCFF